MKRYLCLLLAMVFICLQATAFASGEMPWLPDPAGVFGVPGEFDSEYEYDGAWYRSYVYEFYMTVEEMVEATYAYESRLWEDYGYYVQYFETEEAIQYSMFFHPDNERAMEMAIFIGDEEDMTYDGRDLFYAVLAVPEGFDFIPGSYPDFHVGQCGLCEGSGKCGNCVRGKANYGAGFVDCVICEGSDVCRMCEGTGIY